MWLIDTATLSLDLFYGESIPAYAILSHTWGSDEVSLQEFRELAGRHGSPHASSEKAGYLKIVAACEHARRDGYRYLWIDTCCIDKGSSAELTEAINSMYGWYAGAQICYAFLHDTSVSAEEALSSSVSSVRSGGRLLETSLRRCRWFTRGWCLQELLAPPRIIFFNGRWEEIGTKSSLRRLLARITGVPEAVLATPPEKEIDEFPMARRISWIAGRQTTRTEDMSYSLLGILGINMPMLYGEGSRAFARLQEEIIRKYNDMSIFAWAQEPGSSGFINVLAPSPACFKLDVAQDDDDDDELPDAETWDDAAASATQVGDRLRTQFFLTNQGVVFPSVRLYCQHALQGFRYHYMLPLNYHDASFRGIRDKQWYILLQKVGPGLYARLHEHPDRTAAYRDQYVLDPFYEPVCILNNITPSLNRQLQMWERHSVRLRWKAWPKAGRKYWHIRAMEPRQNWDVIGGQFLVEMASEQYMHVEFVPGNHRTNPGYEYFVVVIQLGDVADVRDPSRITVRTVSSNIWPGANATPFQFASKEMLALQSLPSKPRRLKAGGEDEEEEEEEETSVERISLAGYDMCLLVNTVRPRDDVPRHTIYLDWTESKKHYFRRN